MSAPGPVPDVEAAVLRRVPQESLTIIDAHAHLGPYGDFFIPGSGAEDLIRVMDVCGVRRTVLSSHLAIQLDAVRGNEVTAEAVSAHPHRLAGHLVVNPWQDPDAELARWSGDTRFWGIKLHPDLHGYPLTGDRYTPVWEFAEITGCPVLTHTWTGSAYDDLRHVGAVAERYPGVHVLAGHAGALRQGFEAAMDVAAAHPGVVLEICGSQNSGDVIERMVDRVGAEQVVFGSDIPFIDLRSSLGRVVFADLDDDARRAVLGGTAARLFAWREGTAGSPAEASELSVHNRR